MKPDNFNSLKKDVLPTKQTNILLGLESMLMTSHEINFSDSDEKLHLPHIEEIEFDSWFSWN